MISNIIREMYRIRFYLLLSLVISICAIPVADSYVIMLDRNRNEMYGEAFWLYGFKVYEKTDKELLMNLPPEWGFDEKYTLPDFLNVSYEYPVLGLLFFVLATLVFPGAGGLQPLWINFLLVLFFHFNLVLYIILLREKSYDEMWVRIILAGCYVYGLTMSAGAGKLETVTDTLFLMALVYWKERHFGKSMFLLGLAVQTKIYPIFAFPILFLEAPLMSIWFFVSMLLSIVPVAFFGANLDSLLSHISNTASYSSYIVNPFFPGLLMTPNTGNDPNSYFLWLPALIPVLAYSVFMVYTVPKYLPDSRSFFDNSLWEKIILLKPFYLYMLPAILFTNRWIMPWYFGWFGTVCFLFKDNEQAIGYTKEIMVLLSLYILGIACNWSYFVSGPLVAIGQHSLTDWLILIIGCLLAIIILFCFIILTPKKFRKLNEKVRIALHI